MLNDMTDTIPLSQENEQPVDAEHALSESDQKELAGILDLYINRDEYLLRALSDQAGSWENAWRYQCESAVTVIRTEQAFNYHDESWSNYSVMRFERITQAEFEKKKKTAEQADFSRPFDFLEGKVGSFFVWKCEDRIRGKIKKFSFIDDVYWNWVRIAYIGGIPNVTGFFRLIYASGDDRAFSN